MLRITRDKKRYIAFIIVASLLAGTLSVPGQGALAAERGRDSGTVRGVSDLAASAPSSVLPPSTPEASDLPSSALPSSGGAATATPAGSPEPTPTPAMTAKPNATVLLGDDSAGPITLIYGTKGEFDIDRNASHVFSARELSELFDIYYSVSDDEVLAVTEDGSYQALKVGEATLTLTGYGRERDILFRMQYDIVVIPNMEEVTLEKDSLELYRDRTQSEVSGKLRINSSYVFDEDTQALDYSAVSSNKKMDVYIRISENRIELDCVGTGSTTLTITLYGKVFTVRLRVYAVGLSATSLLKVKHTSGKLKVKGYSGTVVWKSSRPSVVKISKSGKFRAKKEGNAVISAKIKNIKLGCIVSVTTSRKRKAIRRAQRIARTSRYSQPRRMQKGYYDCSSLVWRAYSPYGYRFGASSAPTAAGEASYLAGRHKLLKGGFSKKNVENLKIKAGDLLFETGAKNGRYKGIYHVEMIIGYEFIGWTGKNKPMVAVKWANRPTGYYSYGCGIVGCV